MLRPYYLSNSFFKLGAVILLSIGCAIFLPNEGAAQVVTMNPFIGATETQGLLTLWKGNPANKAGLTFPDESFLTVAVNGVYYTDNPQLGPNSNPPAVSLNFPQVSKVRDTLHTVWKLQGFDIVQDAYPVAFTSSGVIVISVRIVNHGQTPLPAQAQYLMDNENSSSNTANDNPYLITRNGYIRNWEECPPAAVPSFYLAFQNPPSDANLGTVGIGYINDSFPPHPLGLIPLTSIEFGNWPDLVFYTWGPETPTGSFSDEATLMTGPPAGATAFLAGSSDSVTEIFRTAYGTPEWCFDHGNIVGFALYPQHITWDPVRLTYTPNPFQVDAFLFTDSVGQANGTAITQNISDPIHITSPVPPGLPTTQRQVIGTILLGGVSEVEWTDSVLVLPSGCTASFPVDINFNVTTSNLPTPTFSNPWDCSINVDCAHPDTSAPSYRNSFSGCDSIMADTITVQDSRQFDLGLQNITYSSPDMTPAQYSVTINPAPPYQCIDTPAKIYVRQIDTVTGGHVVFTFTDCANNISTETICFTAHPPLPDLTAPRFWLDSTVADCHAQCTEWTVTDSLTSNTSIDHGIDSIVVVSSTNMMVSGIPPGGKFPTGTPSATFHICASDSLLDGTIILRANDTSHHFAFDTITYCTTADTHPPAITATAFVPADLSFHVHVADTMPWDRGVDSVWLEQANNVGTAPASAPYSVPCKATFDFRVVVTDTAECASAMVYSKDCAGNISGPIAISFPKGTIPIVTASKNVLCSPTDSAVLDAGANFSGYLWSNGATTRTITVGQGMYSVTVDEGVNCSATSKTDTIISSPATPQITPAGPIDLCAPDSAQLDAGSGFTSYQWIDNGTAMNGKTSQALWVNSTGNYTVQVTNTADCMGTSQPVSVSIYPIPTQPVITSANNVLTSTPAASYQWSLDSLPIAGATNQSYTPLTGGSYTVTITDANGCSSTSLPFGNAGSTVISVPTLVMAQESEDTVIPLSIASSQNLPQSINRTFTAKIRFNRTLLIPEPPSGGTILSKNVQGDDLIVEYQSSSMATSGLLMNLPFIAALGDDSCTPVTIDSFAWSTPNIAVTVENGTFCLSNLCEQGGTQLIDPNGTVTLSAPQPNPATNSIQINYKLIEKGQTTLTVYDLLGHEVLSLVDGLQTPGTYTASADVSSLAAGTYIYSLHTPTIVKSDYLKIAR